MKTRRSVRITRVGGFLAMLAVSAWMLAADPRGAAAQGGQCGCIDLVFVIDDTGSMGGAIDNVKAGLTAIIAQAQAASGNDLHAALVTFKDVVNIPQGLTSTIADAQTAIMALSASGGGDTPEASDEALQLVATGAADCPGTGGPFGTLRSECVKIAILVTDAPPAGCDDTFTAGVDDVHAAAVATLAANAGIKISAVHILNGDSFDPIETGVMKNYALTTGGAYVEVPSDGAGVADMIMAILNACGSGVLGREAPAVGPSALIGIAAALGGWGFLRIRRRRQR